MGDGGGLRRMVWTARLAVAVALSREPGEAPCGEWDESDGYDCDRAACHEGPHASMYSDGAVWDTTTPSGAEETDG